MASLLFLFIVYIRCRHFITKEPQALLRHLYFMLQKILQLKDRRLPINNLRLSFLLYAKNDSFDLQVKLSEPASVLSYLGIQRRPAEEEARNMVNKPEPKAKKSFRPRPLENSDQVSSNR